MALEPLGAWFDAMRARFRGRLRRDEYVVTECPYCGNVGAGRKGNFEINTNELVFHCWACGVGGTVRGLFLDFGLPVSLLPETALGRRHFLAIEREPVRLPAESQPMFGGGLPLAEFALQYLIEMRGMTKEEVHLYQLTYAYEGRYARRVIWPLYEGEELVYFVARRFMRNAGRAYDYPEHRRRSITPIYTGTSRRLTLVMVEGVFEIFKIQRLGYSVMPLLGATVNPVQVSKLRRRNFERYVVFLDRDAVRNSIKIAEALRAERLDATYVYSHGPDSDELEEDELTGILDDPRMPGVRSKVMVALGRLT